MSSESKPAASSPSSEAEPFILHVSADPSLVPPEVSGEINDKEYPLGCFDAQVRFAQRWAEITGEDFEGILLRKTALWRTISGKLPPEESIPAGWAEILDNTTTVSESPESISRRLYQVYASQPHSLYRASEHPGAFGYDYYPDRHTVKVHFDNPVRGESPFSQENLPRRSAEFGNMLNEIQDTHPEAETVVSASWIRSTRSYAALFPSDLAEPEDLMSPDMFFSGDYVWGQFIDRHGQTSQRVYYQFAEAIGAAGTLDELIAAFPFRVLKVEDPIGKYYEFYGIGTDQ